MARTEDSSAGVALKFRTIGDRVVGYACPEGREPDLDDPVMIAVHRRSLEVSGLVAWELTQQLGEMLISAAVEAALGVQVTRIERRGPGAPS